MFLSLAVVLSSMRRRKRANQMKMVKPLFQERCSSMTRIGDKAVKVLDLKDLIIHSLVTIKSNSILEIWPMQLKDR